MKAFNGFKSEARNTKTPPLPAGPYVAKIKAAKADDEFLTIRVDVCEGPFTDYFVTRYKREDNPNSRYPAKYKGDFRVRIPSDDENDQYRENNLRNFNDAIFRIESSNPGYHWDWDEAKLAGLIVGINMQGREYNGAYFTQIGRLEIAQDVRAGIVPVMEPKDGAQPPTAAQTVPAGYTPAAQDEELPF